ncbi:predicted protein [Naegleria gruberi]|uniref:Predicted protein n=1 Tax=Naegleria gruberi TaxID=5762 RepID=D2VAP2_NAEGR|nr:uncharacterized protein NAEGRDRAFT_48002 [Naegleria gruberi]EFC46110.1 predicted protein [Naegleria gruberi]|eukprot:XP_002678854.1 predicted protein [Naegleria gruberi strain NEG-M]
MSFAEPVIIDDESDTESSNSIDEEYITPANLPHLSSSRCPSCHYNDTHCDHRITLYQKIHIVKCFIAEENRRVFSEPSLPRLITENKLIPFIDNLLLKFIENIQEKSWKHCRQHYVPYLMENFYLKINRKARELQERFGIENGQENGSENEEAQMNGQQQPPIGQQEGWNQNVQQQAPQQPRQIQTNSPPRNRMNVTPPRQIRQNNTPPRNQPQNENVIRTNQQANMNPIRNGNQNERVMNHVPLNNGQVVRHPQNQSLIGQPHLQQFNNASINHFSMNSNGNGFTGFTWVNVQLPNIHFPFLFNGLAQQLPNNNIRPMIPNQQLAYPNPIIHTPQPPMNRPQIIPIQLNFHNQQRLFGFTKEELMSMSIFKQKIKEQWNLPTNCVISNISFIDSTNQTLMTLDEQSLLVIRESALGRIQIQFEIYENTDLLPLSFN